MLPHIEQTEASNIPTTSYTGLATLTYGEQYQHTAGALKANVAETQLATSPYPSASLRHLQRPSVNTIRPKIPSNKIGRQKCYIQTHLSPRLMALEIIRGWTLRC